MTFIFDTRLSEAVRNAVNGNAKALTTMLRTNSRTVTDGDPQLLVLGPGERELLADLIDELALRKPKRSSNGRPSQNRYTGTEQRRAVVKYRELLASGNVIKKKAVGIIAEEMKVSDSLVRSWIKDVCDAEEKLKKMGLPNWRLED